MVCLAFGPYYLGFQVANSRIRDYLFRKFSKHLTSSSPDLLFEVNVDTSGVVFPIEPARLDNFHSVDKTRFCFVDDVIKGEFLGERNCRLYVKDNIRDDRLEWIFKEFLVRTFYYLEHLENPKGPSRFLCHASAVSRKGKGLVFSGPSGSGKTTIATLLDTGKVLHDESVMISLTERTVRSTPIQGKFPEYVNEEENLDALFFLEQDTRVHVQPLSRFEAYKRLFRQVATPLTLLDNGSRKAFEYKDQFCFEFISRIPCHMLSFPKNDSFWGAIEEVVNRTED